jgi:hypothetical protein
MSLPHGVQARQISRLLRQGHSTTLDGGQIGQTKIYYGDHYHDYTLASLGFGEQQTT